MTDKFKSPGSTSGSTQTEKPVPGVTREQRISDEGLQRLEKHLKSGAKISQQVLQQWVKRYGNAATLIIDKYKKD